MRKLPAYLFILLMLLAVILPSQAAVTRPLQLSEDQKTQIRAIKKIKLEIRSKYTVRGKKGIEVPYKTDFREMQFPYESNLRDLFACVPIEVVNSTGKDVAVLKLDVNAEIFYRQWYKSLFGHGATDYCACGGAKATGKLQLISASHKMIFQATFSGESDALADRDAPVVPLTGLDGTYLPPDEAIEGALCVSSTDGTSMNRILMGVIYDCFGQEPILKIYKSNRPGLSELAGAMLPGLGDAAVLQLIDVITDPKSSRSQIRNAAYTLGKMGDKRAVRPLIDCLRTHRFWDVDAEGNMTGGAVVSALMKITGYVPEDSFDPNTIYQVWNDWWNKQPK